MKLRFITLIVLLFVFVNISAQDGYTVKVDSLQSQVLKQNRKLHICLPEGYDESVTNYPVIYILDAVDRDQHAVPTARFLFLNQKMPKAIIVGILNIDRNHDFLPDSSKNAPTGGGADNFVRFFKSELIPYISKNFKAEPFKVLIGHSYGGVFAMHALITDPELFDAYIAIDPSFWYKDNLPIRNAKEEFQKAKDWDRSIFITGREGEGMKGMGINDMDSLLKLSAPKDLAWKIVSYPNEDHGSVTFKSVYDGLRYIFDSGNNFRVHPLSGIIPKGTSTYAIIENMSPNIRYTLDGSEPTVNSPVCETMIKISEPCTLKVKSLGSKYKNYPTISRVFMEGEFIKAPKPAKNLIPGLKYSYYEGVWDSIPDFSKLTPVKTGITDKLDFRFALKRDSFAVQFEGYLHITEKNMYNIWVVSDDGSKVYFNNQLLLDNDGLHSADVPVVKLLPLEPGYYPIMINCFEKTGGESIDLGYLIGNGKPESFKKESLFYKK